MNRFFNKTQKHKVIRPIQNSRLPHRTIIEDKPKDIEKEENNILKEETEMEDKRLEKIEKIMSSKAPKRKVKVEKKDKGLIERTENSTILLTEDNKMLLTD